MRGTAARLERTTGQGPRQWRVEALRLVAIGGIAVFHTFVPWFDKMAYAAPFPTDCRGLSTSFWGLFLLGCINLLGAMGNAIFFMISGYFLLPSMARDSHRPGYAARQGLKAARRAAVIVATIAVYSVLTVSLMALLHIPGPDFRTTRWLVMDLEFVWLYLLFVVIAPLIARAQDRWSAWPLVLIAAFIVVFALNGYVAFFSQGGVNHALDGWRKWLSAATYFVGFCLAGLMDQHRASLRRWGAVPLWWAIGASVVVELGAAVLKSPWLSGAISFKSTSLLSFWLALAALSCAVLPRGESAVARPAGARHASHLPDDRPGPAAVRLLASGILGFYVFQSMLTRFWHSLIIPALDGLVSGPSVPFSATLLFVAAGTAASLLYATVLLCVDRAVRQPATRAIAQIFQRR